MKKFFTLIICLAIYGIAFSQTNVSGIITTDSTWDIAGSPYIVTGDITVNTGITLTVDPNVEVKFNSSRRMYVYGTLTANTATFTSNQVVPAAGDWLYIQVGNSSYSGIANLTSCVLQYAQKFYVYNGTATLVNTNIEFFYYYGAEVNDVFNMTGGLIDMTGYHSSYGHGLYARDGSVCTLNNMSIINGKYGINLTTTSQTGLTDCTVTSNEWPVYYNGPGALTVNGTCDFTGNTRDAFYVGFSSNSNVWTLPSINDNIVLVEDYVPYYFYNTYTVNNGGSLIIGSNNVLKFRLSQALYIRGTLTANAGVGKNIYFTSERDDNWGGDTNGDGTSTSPATSNWYGIRFYDESNDASVMRRCMLRYAGYTSLGGVTLYDASPVIDYCDFSHNYFGVYLQYTSSPTFTNNTIGSSSMTPIAMSFEANPTFTNNVLSFSENQYDAIGLIGGTLSANAHIIQRNFTTVNNITYLMLAQITVPSGITLTIDPGIVIKSTSYSYRIIIEGKLDAVGTGTDFITFTSVKDDTHGNPGDTNRDGAITSPSIGDMGAIIFEDGSDPASVMDYVRMKYARVYNYYYSNGGQNHYLNSCAVATINVSPTISNCEFRELDYGVSCYTTSNPVISNNAMINISNTPFSISASANPAFSGNTYTNIGMNAIGLLGHNIVVNSNIIKRTVAGFTNMTYVLLEDIDVLNGANLDIAPGVVIKIVSKGWDIQGGFKCNGTVTEHVVFTSLYDDNVGNPMDTNGDGNATTPSWGNWHDISFEENSDDLYCDLVYTDLQYGGYYYNGIVTTTNASPGLNNVLIDQSYYYGLWFNGNSAPVVNNVDINNCRLDPIAISLTSNPTFSGITFSANGSNGIRIIEGTLSSNATLVKRNIAGFTNIAYIIDDLNIASGAVLTLEEGIIIKFDGNYFKGIFIHGGLNATGTVSENIYFTSIKDDSAGGDTNNDGGSTVPVNSDWHGLVYYPEGDDAQNKLIYCEVRYTGGGYTNYLGSYTLNGAVRVKDAYINIDHTIFQQSSQTALGIFGSANPDVTNCQMYNINYEPVYMALFSSPVFSNNTIGNAGRVAIGIQPETYSQNATVPQRTFAGYSNITYFFYDATINSGTTITIPAGTVFKSSSGANFTVNGTLEVNGAVGDSVIFTDYRDDDYGNPLDTEGNGSGSTPTNYGPYFIFNDVSNDASFINYAVIRYSTDAVRLNSASPSITNNTFYKVDYGITNSGVCAPVVENNVFDDLDYAPMSISLVSYPASTSGNIISGTTYKGIKVKDETLTQDATLQKRPFGGISNIPYIFQTYTIGTGVTLTIDPGVVLKFIYGGWMTVNNGLIAEGLASSDMNIVFTSLSDDFYGGDTNADSTYTSYESTTWYGITFNSVALDPLCRFENCIFRFAKYSTGTAIKTINASPSILNCSFNNNDYGVYATGASDPTVNYCDFFDNYYMAVNNVNGSFTIDAENCWWGDDSGPTHSGNPGGTGEVVSDDVNYYPYGTSGAINPLLGDVSLNSIIQAYDASLVLLFVVDTITYPLTPTQQNVADVSGAAGVTAYDASLILQYVVGLINYFPAALLNPMPNIVSEVELIVGNETVEPGEVFNLPLSIADVSGLYAMQMTIEYNQEFLEALEVESMLTGMNATYEIDQENGLIKIAFAGIESLESDMTIANIVFKASDELTTGITTPVTAKFFMANETDLTWNVSNGSVLINGFATGFEDEPAENNSLLFCYPNPFTDNLNINYTVPVDGDFMFIAVYNMYGRAVAEIINGKHSEGTYTISWNGDDLNGKKLTKGTYFIRLIAGGKTETQKIQVVR